ncbi:MAG TPA: amidohydrolase [Candidatus Limnocylindrales bacterium]|nr:amidohydrolase [Candidatus Limnocylindrales bacterium]
MQADIVLVNARLFGSAGEALAIAGDRISGIGSAADVRGWRGPRTQVVDVAGGLLVPGFDDAHLHLRHGALALDQLDLFGITELGAIQRAVAAYGAAHAGDGWVVGRGWFYAAFPGGLPTRQQLDAVIADRPAYFACFDAHSGWANTRALELAGIGANTPDPPAGEIVRDADGNPTGALLERATALVESVLPQPGPDDVDRLMGRALSELARSGITACQDAWADIDDIQRLERLRDRSGLPVRVRLARELLPGARPETDRQLQAFAEEAQQVRMDAFLQGGIIKSFLDGVVEAGTAWFLDPYPGTENRGDPRWQPGDIRTGVLEAHRRGWQVELHAIGTAAVRQALDVYQSLGPGEAAARRHRVEHIETLHPVDLPRFAELGVVASMQPYHAVPESSQSDTWRAALDPAVADAGWPIASLLRSGAHVCFGSDWPVVPFDPLLGLHAAVNRRSADGFPPNGFNAAEAVAVAQAISCFTQGSAFAEHADRERGQLREGMLADLTVLDRDLLTEGGEAIVGTRVILTMVGGRMTHRLV